MFYTLTLTHDYSFHAEMVDRTAVHTTWKGVCLILHLMAQFTFHVKIFWIWGIPVYSEIGERTSKLDRNLSMKWQTIPKRLRRPACGIALSCIHKTSVRTFRGTSRLTKLLNIDSRQVFVTVHVCWPWVIISKKGPMIQVLIISQYTVTFASYNERAHYGDFWITQGTEFFQLTKPVHEKCALFVHSTRKGQLLTWS